MNRADTGRTQDGRRTDSIVIAPLVSEKVQKCAAGRSRGSAGAGGALPRDGARVALESRTVRGVGL